MESYQENTDLIPKQLFFREITTKGIIVPQEKIKSIATANANIMLSIPKVQNIVPSSKALHKIILLGPDKEIPESLQEFENISHTVTLNYPNFSYHEVLQELIPSHVTIPSGFETIGHIAHFNLNESQLPYKKIIGQVLLDKNPHIKTVVTKTSKIDNIFRTFPMEIIAGVHQYETEVVKNKQKEGNCVFKFNFRDVYWNSKLSAERDRVLSNVKSNEIVFDVFAGVGPFSIRAAKKGCKVIANDLNPESFRYLLENTKKNKVLSRLRAFNMDAREIVVKFLGGELEKHWENDGIEKFPNTFDHLYMNLPKDAIEFLDVLRGRFRKDVWEKMPMIHVYGFAKEEGHENLLVERIKNIWGDFDENCLKIVHVRDISSKKYMYCVEFYIPESIAFNQERVREEQKEEIIVKKIKIDEKI